jgi:hypothetical protein
MNRRGVCYDAGRVMWGQDWRPEFSPEEARRELQIIRDGQIGRGTTSITARPASDHELDRYWPRLTKAWPAYQAFYDNGGKRSVFVLEPDGPSSTYSGTKTSLGTNPVRGPARSSHQGTAPPVPVSGSPGRTDALRDPGRRAREPAGRRDQAAGRRTRR